MHILIGILFDDLLDIFVGGLHVRFVLGLDMQVQLSAADWGFLARLDLHAS